MADPKCSECGEQVAPRRRKCDDCRAPARTTLTGSEQRARDAVSRRAGGATFATIAEELGYATAAGALKAYRRGMAGTGLRGLSLDEKRELELHRIDRILDSIFPDATGGDLAAVDRFERLSRRRERLEGMAIAPNGPGRNAEASDDDHDAGTVVSAERLEKLRRERGERARQRTAGSTS